MNYAWIMWLPYYLYTVVKLSHWTIGIITFMYEIGAIVGAFGGGWISDAVNSRSETIKYMLLSAAPLIALMWYLDQNMTIIIQCCVFGLGITIAGVCYLTNCCISADLADGGHQAGTVSGVLDGTGSLVAGIGIFFIGYLQQFSWLYVFGVILFADIIAVILLQLIHLKKQSQK